jgi:hypothetical protein
MQKIKTEQLHPIKTRNIQKKKKIVVGDTQAGETHSAAGQHCFFFLSLHGQRHFFFLSPRPSLLLFFFLFSSSTHRGKKTQSTKPEKINSKSPLLPFDHSKTNKINKSTQQNQSN